MNEPTQPAGNAASHALADAELSALVAEKVAGYTFYPDPFEPPMSRLEVPEKWCYRDRSGTFYIGEPYQLHKEAFAEIGLRWGYMWTRPKFATSADAVLPLLEKCNAWQARHEAGLWHTVDVHPVSPGNWFYGFGDTFARAACNALLRAHAVAERATPTGKDAL